MEKRYSCPLDPTPPILLRRDITISALTVLCSISFQCTTNKHILCPKDFMNNLFYFKLSVFSQKLIIFVQNAVDRYAYCSNRKLQTLDRNRTEKQIVNMDEKGSHLSKD